eukprot:CAMPEP_0183702872 /NCGR_PEP_ID=MMETSP0737-20130205/832_1 /TAXON_ID=385413 /ORGANISM="Thalassiosira miniscula, Strain CCMP1093" /LENGTH=82 /DNA_ID=CAMNT_0025929555 /DNA_START=1 /DNA_END=249 /DNA_ORIENTATION=+
MNAVPARSFLEGGIVLCSVHGIGLGVGFVDLDFGRALVVLGDEIVFFLGMFIRIIGIVIILICCCCGDAALVALAAVIAPLA